MFDITDNFAVAIRLNNIYLRADSLHINLFQGKRGGFDCTHKDETGLEVSSHFKTENEVWAALPALCPTLLSELDKSFHPYHWGLARRAELFQSAARLAAAQEQFERAPRLMFEALAETLDGVLVGVKPKLRPTANKLGISLWQLRGRCRFPHYPEPQALVVKMFPSPINPLAWLMRVYLPGTTSDIIRHNQGAIRRAIYLLDNRGVTIEDVTQGTTIEL